MKEKKLFSSIGNVSDNLVEEAKNLPPAGKKYIFKAVSLVAACAVIITGAAVLLPRGARVVMVGRLDPVIIQVPVYEGELSNIAVGDQAEVSISSLRDKTFAATVSEISWTASDMNVSNPSYYTVELSVPNPNFELKPGYKAVVRFAVK